MQEALPEEGPHHFAKNNDCSFTFTEGLAPLDQELVDLRAQVKFLQEALEKKSEPDEDAEMYRAAYQRMRENFQVSLNTIRQLEDLLHQTQRELEQDREEAKEVLAQLQNLRDDIRAARHSMRVTG